jgi:hypothetical protein
MAPFDGIKDKADEAKKKVDKKRDKSISTALDKVSDAKTTFKKPLAEPETRKEATLTSEKRFFICGSCGAELGPLEEKQYSKLIKPALKGSKAIIGVATGNPVMAVSNAAKAAKGTSDASTVDDSGLMKLPHSRIKEIKQNRSEGEEFLSQCGGCAKWICMECWNADKEVCTDCK